MSEMKLVSLKCPNCSGKLDIGPSIETFACGYCGANVQVERGGNIVSLHLLADAIRSVQRGTDRTAAELAIRRISGEIALMQLEMEKCVASRQVVSAKWTEKMQSVGLSDSAIPLTFVVVTVGGVTAAMLAQIDFLKPPVVLAMSATATLASMIYVARIILRGQRKNLAAQSVIRDREINAILTVEKDIQRRIEVASSNLRKHKHVVDS